MTVNLRDPPLARYPRLETGWTTTPAVGRGELPPYRRPLSGLPAITRSLSAPAPRASPVVKSLNLALQGGGAHGAIAWGILDRLLEDDRIAFDGISATSAGAMNAVSLAYGWAIGGRDGARRTLDCFWDRIGDLPAFGRAAREHDRRCLDLLRAWPGARLLELSAQAFSLGMTSFLSPYEFNPLNINPLRDALAATVDFAILRSAACPINLFISATNVRSGKLKVFTRRELTVDMVMASACLPQLFQAVEINGEHYWDGGYIGNPAIFPLMLKSASRDIVLVRVNPLARDELPRTTREIRDRIGEINFNSALVREIQAIAFVTELIDDDRLSGKRRLNRPLIHSIAADEDVMRLPVCSRLNTDKRFLLSLKESGRRLADDWLATHFDMLGRASTINLEKDFL
jgi:NTE family protein